MNSIESIEHLRQSLVLGMPIYVLIDPVLGDPLPDVAIPLASSAQDVQTERETIWQRQVVPVPLDPSIKLPPAYQPYLVLLTKPSDHYLELTCEIAEGERSKVLQRGLDGSGEAIFKIGGWLQTTMPAEQLAAMLGRWMRLKTGIPVAERYLRLADSRVLALLCHVLSDQALIARMGRLSRWIYLDAYNRKCCLENSEAHVANEQWFDLPILTPRQWLDIQRGNLIHAAIAKVHLQRFQVSQESTADEIPPYRSALKLAEIWSARRDSSDAVLWSGINTREDRVAAISLSLLSPDWQALPAIRGYLASKKADWGLRYCASEIYQLMQQNHPNEKT